MGIPAIRPTGAVLIFALVFLQSTPCFSGQQQHQQQQQAGPDRRPAEKVESAARGSVEALAQQLGQSLYDCQLHYAQLPDSYTRLSLHHLVLSSDRKRRPGRGHGDATARNLSSSYFNQMRKIDYFEKSNNGSQQQLNLDGLDLDPTLPFVFFTNGFNHDGILDGTWMQEVASVYLARYLVRGRRQGGGVNVVFLNWHMEGLLASNSLSMIPVYYRTMANYDIIVSKFQNAILQILDRLDQLRWPLSSTGDTSYYAKWRFFGHSLGSHILAHALRGVHRLRPKLKFGQIYGLDPAIPCFLNDQQGLTASRATGLTREVVVVHSNAGILGAYSERGQVEIVLNGGTFQPNCSLLDLKCHHLRSTDVLGYLDDTCKMVAYKCNKYEQFKLGACETCDAPSSMANGAATSATASCVLVNLEEQNEDSQLIEGIIVGNQRQRQKVRQLADNNGQSGDEDGDGDADQGADRYNFERATLVGLAAELELNSLLRANPKAEYHFVNTNTKLAQTNGGRSHCLQHYQLRLLTLNSDSNEPPIEGDSRAPPAATCPISLLYDDGIRVQLYREPPPPMSEPPDDDKDEDEDDGGANETRRATKDQIDEFQLTTILENRLHTGLATFEGIPQLFVGAVISNLDLSQMSACFDRHQRESSNSSSSASDDEPASNLEFVLDIAFMSHTRKSVRHAFSSVLCARWPSSPDSDTDDPDSISTSELRRPDTVMMARAHNGLVLNLCRQSELANVSAKVDQLLRQVKFRNQFEPWHVILLNSLFSLFAGWEPF